MSDQKKIGENSIGFSLFEKPENFMQALNRKSDDTKVVIQFSEI